MELARRSLERHKSRPFSAASDALLSWPVVSTWPHSYDQPSMASVDVFDFRQSFWLPFLQKSKDLLSTACYLSDTFLLMMTAFSSFERLVALDHFFEMTFYFLINSKLA